MFNILRGYQSATLSFYINLQCICRRKLLFLKHSLAHTNTHSPDRQEGVSLTVKYCRPIRALIIKKKILFMCDLSYMFNHWDIFFLLKLLTQSLDAVLLRLHGPFSGNTRYTASVYTSFASRSTQTVTFPLKEKHPDCLKTGEKHFSSACD